MSRFNTLSNTAASKSTLTQGNHPLAQYTVQFTVVPRQELSLLRPRLSHQSAPFGIRQTHLRPHSASHSFGQPAREIPLTPSPAQHRQSGFTLIEVMVALAILAVVAVAASRASSAYLRSVDTLKTRTLAHFVAQNTAADLQMNQTWVEADQTKQINEQGREWQVLMKVSDTMTPAVKEVTIAVAPIVEGSAQNTVTDVTVMVSDPEASGRLDLTGRGR